MLGLFVCLFKVGLDSNCKCWELLLNNDLSGIPYILFMKLHEKYKGKKRQYASLLNHPTYAVHYFDSVIKGKT